MRKGYGLKVLAVFVITLFGFQLSTSVVRADPQFNVQQNPQLFTNYPSSQPSDSKGTVDGAHISDDGSVYGITAFPPGPYPGSDPNEQSDYPNEAYIVDRTTGAPTFIAYTDDGRSFWDLGFETDTVGISRDGRYVLYEAVLGPQTGPYSHQTGADTPLLGGYVYDRQTQQSVRVTQQNTNPAFNINTFAISGDGRYIIYTLLDYTGGHAYIHDRVTGNEFLIADGNPGNFALSNDGRFVVYGNNNNQVDLLDRQTGVVSVLATNLPSGSNVAVSDDGNIVAYDYIQNSIGHVVVINRTTGITTNKSQGSFRPELSGDGSTLVTGTLSHGPVKYSSPADGLETILSQNSQTFPESINTNGSMFTTDSYDATTAQGWTNTVFVTKFTAPSAPTNLTAASPTHNPALSWNAVSGATSYNIHRNGSPIDTITTGATSYTDYLAPEGNNTYYVTAVNSGGESGPSNSVTVLVDRTSPTVTNVTLATDPLAVNQTTTLSANVTDNIGGSGIAKAEYYVGTDPGAGNGTPMSISGSTATATVGPYATAGMFTYSVRTQDNAGNWSVPTSINLDVYNPSGGYVASHGSVVPNGSTSNTNPNDVLPTETGNNVKATFDFTVKYLNSTDTTPTGTSTFTWGSTCNNPHSDCFVVATDTTVTPAIGSLAWLVVPGDNTATFQGTASVSQGSTNLGTNYPVRISVTGTTTTSPGHYLLQVYSVGSNPDTASPLYQASGDLSGGSVVLHG